MYRDQILSLAMNRFRWVNLPKSCDARFLEYTLCMDGVATIAKPEQGLQAWVSTQCTSGQLNIYDNPTEWESTGNNGWNFHVTPRNGVLVWDNIMRYPLWNNIHLWSLRLAEFDRVLDVNLQQQKIPWILKGPQTKVLDMENVLKQTVGGEPAIIGFKGLEDIDLELLATQVDFKGEELQMAKNRLWNEIYSALGIKSVDRKQERMIEAEVKNNDDPTEIMLLNCLKCRRAAAEYLNEHFDFDIHVFRAEDLESDNFNYKFNLEKLDDNSSSTEGDGQDAENVE